MIFAAGFLTGMIVTIAIVVWAVSGEQPVPQFVGYEGTPNE